MADIVDELIGCHCDEAVNCVETIFRHDDNGDGLLVTTFACGGCDKRIKVVSRIESVLDIHETTTPRATSLTPNEWRDNEE